MAECLQQIVASIRGMEVRDVDKSPPKAYEAGRMETLPPPSVERPTSPAPEPGSPSPGEPAGGGGTHEAPEGEECEGGEPSEVGEGMEATRPEQPETHRARPERWWECLERLAVEPVWDAAGEPLCRGEQAACLPWARVEILKDGECAYRSPRYNQLLHPDR
ncbi:hypothetical protein CYMTET_20781 [Cymbomonas tetramitiformis]|uniref:Uncharacterized protein n=1 Tax=Cymbomonas tetramitiformis TaxID=36881 RepID=A0AAE0G3L6_9CHLO|nr:hypothetical protein CYMTET_20781 [Cymbomonas tetramitiformis]|eukprot:gene12510-14782_t